MAKDEMIKEMQKDLIMAEQDCVWLYEKEGYRKVADNEQIVNAEQLNETLNSTLESGKRMGYAQGRDETAREILQDMYDEAMRYSNEVVELTAFQIKQLAKAYGIELE